MDKTNKYKIDKVAIGFIAPAFLFYVIFVIFPAVSSVFYSFTNWDGISKTYDFIGWRNYIEIISGARFHNALKNTILLTTVMSVFSNVVALGLAMMVDYVARGKNLFRSIFYIPVLLSGIVSGFIWKILYNYNFGAFNDILMRIGDGEWRVHWIDGNATVALISLCVVMIWKYSGYYMIIYLAALQGIPKDVVEASSIDGASLWQRFRNITVPLISGAFTINFTLALIRGLKIFDEIAVMTDGGPGFSTETIVYLLYKVGFNEGRQGFGTAVGLTLLALILILNYAQNKILKSREVQL